MQHNVLMAVTWVWRPGNRQCVYTPLFVCLFVFKTFTYQATPDNNKYIYRDFAPCPWCIFPITVGIPVVLRRRRVLETLFFFFILSVTNVCSSEVTLCGWRGFCLRIDFVERFILHMKPCRLLLFFFHLRAHNQHVDYSGAYNHDW